MLGAEAVLTVVLLRMSCYLSFLKCPAVFFLGINEFSLLIFAKNEIMHIVGKVVSMREGTWVPTSILVSRPTYQNPNIYVEPVA